MLREKKKLNKPSSMNKCKPDLLEYIGPSKYHAYKGLPTINKKYT